jgi:hypothetical protein
MVPIGDTNAQKSALGLIAEGAAVSMDVGDRSMMIGIAVMVIEIAVALHEATTAPVVSLRISVRGWPSSRLTAPIVNNSGYPNAYPREGIVKLFGK